MSQPLGPGLGISPGPTLAGAISPTNARPGTRSGLVALFEGIRDYFEAHHVPAAVHMGWQARFRVDNQGPGGGSRVIVVPGTLRDGASQGPFPAGALTKPRHTHEGGRELAWWHRSATLSVWGVDRARPVDDAAQIEATETLFEHAMRAAHNNFAGTADIIWGETVWTKPPTTAAFGLELLVNFEHGEALFDEPEDLAYPIGVVSRLPAT